MAFDADSATDSEHEDFELVDIEFSDAELITAVRSGDETAFGTLWSRHELAARRLARQISNPSNADDLVSEAFYRVLRALKSGSGPDGAFRPYLFSTLRRINIDNGRSYYTRVALTDDDTELDLDPSESAADVLVANTDGSAAWRAWNSLPDNTRTLLWHLLIEEETPAQIAPLIGTTPNGVSSRAVRAKERLRQAFLQQHLLDAETESCRRTRGRLGEYVRDALSTRDRAEVQVHLDTCVDCQRALFEVTDLNQTMRVFVAPMVLGGVALAGHYLASSGATTATAAGKGSILGHVSIHHLKPIQHLAKNPAMAASVVGVVIVAGIGSAFAVNAINSGHPVAAKRVEIAPAPIRTTPVTAPTSATTIAPTPTSLAPSATPSSTPTVVITTPATTKPAVAPIQTTPAPTPTPTPPAPAPATTTVYIAVVPAQSAPSAVLDISVPTGWSVTSVNGPSHATCTTSGTTGQCTLDNPPAGVEQDFTVVATVPADPQTSDQLEETYTDQNSTSTNDYPLWGS